MHYPRVTILSPHLTEIVPLHGHLWQPQKQVQTRGVLGIPPFDHVLGGMPPQIYYIYVLPPRDHPFPSLDRNHTPT